MKSLISVGFLGKTHGVQGFIRVVSECGSDEWIRPGQVVFTGKTDGSARLNEIAETRESANGDWFIRFEKYQTPEMARQLSGLKVFLPEDEVPEPVETEWDELNGFEISDQTSGISLGTVIRMEPSPAHPMLVVLLHTEREILIPLVEDWIVTVNPGKKQITMALPDGLVDS